MTAYDTVASFGGVYFKAGNITERRKPSTLKTNVGKTFVEKEIPLRNTVDIILSVTGVIDGLSRTAAQSKATAIENDRDSLVALEDGFHHVYADGRHSGNFAIVSESLVFVDDANREPGEPIKFTMEIIEWQ